jgi:HEAT repeat protein
VTTAGRPRTKTRVLSALGIVDGEQGLALWTAVLFMVTQSTHGLGANAADTLFFLRFGVEELPTMIALAGGAVMILVLGHTMGLTAKGEQRWLPLVTGAGALWVLLTWAGVFTASPIMYPIIWVSTQGIIMLTFTMMWNAAGAVCTTRQAKRLFPLFASAGVMGGILGNLATGPIAAVFGAESLLLFQGALLAVSALLVRRLAGRMDDGSSDRSRAIPAVDQFRGALDAVASSKLLKLAAAIAFATWILFYLVVFPFSEAVTAAFDTEAEVASFLGVFSSIATGITFVVGLTVAKRLFSRIGIVMSLLILPAVYAAGFGLWLTEFSLGTAALVRGAQWVALNAIGATAFTALFNVLTGRRRAQVVAFMTAVPAQIGVIVGGLLLIASETIGLAVSLMAVTVVLAMRPAYLDAVVSSVRKGLTGLFDVPSPGLVSPVDGETTRILQAHLTDERPRARAYALSALARFGMAEAIDWAAGYLQDESPEVRAAAFDVVCDWDPEGFGEHAAIALNDENPEVRIRALHYAASVDEAAVEEALADPDPRVRATAAAIVGGDSGRAVAQEVLDAGDLRSKRALLSEIIRTDGRLEIDADGLLSDKDAEVRALAARASLLLGASPERIRPLLNDASLRVRRASAEALSDVESGRELLLEVLQVGTVNETDEALRALVPLEELTEDSVEWARAEAERAARLDRILRSLRGANRSATARFLRRVLDERANRLEQWVLMAMTTVDTEDVMPIVQRGVGAEDPETRAQAIEAIETLGDRRVLAVLLPLLDQPAGETDLSEREALRELSTDFDPWLRALSLRYLAESIRTDLDHIYETARTDDSDLVRTIVPSLAPMPLEKSDMLEVMDRVLALQRVPMFADLDPEDLEILARSTNEIAFEPGEVIYREGGEGSEALMIVDGGAVVSVTREGEKRIVNEYGPGDSVGELALLGSGVRSADVSAGDEGLHGLVITKSEFISILEERPSVALGMLSTLAVRIAEET